MVSWNKAASVPAQLSIGMLVSWSRQHTQTLQALTCVLSCCTAGGTWSMEAVDKRMQRYSRVIDNMKKLLESERRLVRQLRTERAADFAGRSEVQQLLLDSIEEVKQRRRCDTASILDKGSAILQHMSSDQHNATCP